MQLFVSLGLAVHKEMTYLASLLCYLPQELGGEIQGIEPRPLKERASTPRRGGQTVHVSLLFRSTIAGDPTYLRGGARQHYDRPIFPPQIGLMIVFFPLIKAQFLLKEQK